MKILKPGKVEMRKFVCQECGCTFVACEADAYDDYIKCPQEGCESIVSWKDEGEPYEEPAQYTQSEQVRMIDDLGRVQIPKEIRREFNIEPGDKIEFSTNPETKTITLKKVNA